MRQTRMTAIIGLLLLTFFLSNAMAAESVPIVVRDAAERGLTRYFSEIPTEELIKIGLPEGFIAADVSLGSPVRIHALDYGKFVEGVEQSPLALLQEKDTWLFPVVYNGDYVCMITVDYHQDVWQAVQIGKAGLSREVKAVIDAYPREEGYEHLFVGGFPRRSLCMLVSKENDYRFYPFKSARVVLNLPENGKLLYSPNELKIQVSE